MKPNLSLTLLGAALLAVPAVFGQATSGVVGFSNITCPVGTSIVVPSLVNASVFQGQATISIDGLTVTPTTAPAWTAGAYNATAFSAPTRNYPKFYAEIVSGGSEGLVIDISSNTTTALTMASAVSPSGLRGTTVQIAVRAHVTLDNIVSGATGLSAYADSANVYNSNGSTSTRIYDGASWVDEGGSNPAGHTVIYPGTGLVCSLTNPVTFTFMGEVKPTKTQIPMFAGAINIVAPLNPASSTLLYNNTSLVAALGDPYAAGINRFSADGQMIIVGSNFSDGSAMTDSSGTPLAPSATDSISINRGIVISVAGDTVWTVNSPLTP